MRAIAVIAIGALLCSRAFAQDATPAPDAQLAATTVSPSANGAGGPASGELLLPKLTPVLIQVLAPLGSKLSKTGDTFPIALAQPIVIGGKEVVAAGATGMGEVIFAKKSGGMGAAGELVVTARYLDVGGRRLELRSMHFAEAGKDNYKLVNGIMIGSAATFVPVSFVGFFITGKQVNVPMGALAEAKTAEDFTLTPADSAAGVPLGNNAATGNGTARDNAASDAQQSNTGSQVKEGVIQ